MFTVTESGDRLAGDLLNLFYLLTVIITLEGLA